jgi:hypothetical protein
MHLEATHLQQHLIEFGRYFVPTRSLSKKRKRIRLRMKISRDFPKAFLIDYSI